jgi:hypothetical protein
VAHAAVRERGCERLGRHALESACHELSRGLFCRQHGAKLLPPRECSKSHPDGEKQSLGARAYRPQVIRCGRDGGSHCFLGVEVARLDLKPQTFALTSSRSESAAPLSSAMRWFASMMMTECGRAGAMRLGLVSSYLAIHKINNVG